MTRPSLDAMLMEMAHVAAKRSTCSRLSVGAVLALDGRVLSTGYNGSAAGLGHCLHAVEDDTPCSTAVHAETNAVAFAARHGAATDGATLYVTASPCAACSGLLINAGIRTVHYATPYRSSTGIDRLRKAGVQVAQLRL